MKNLPRFVVSSVIGAAAVVASTGPIGCDDAGSGTTGRRVALDVKIAASPDSRQFTNAKGWSVTITKATVSTGAFYFYDGDTLFARGRSRLARGFVKVAVAHPGHYVPGNAKGELLTPSSADLLAGADLGRGDGITGPVRSATFTYTAPATGPMAGELGANVIVLEGSAAKGVESRTFRAEIKPDEMRDAKGVTQIEGCPFTAADMQSDGTVTISVKLPIWFDQVEFEGVAPSRDGSPVMLADGLARNQLVRGTKGSLSYSFAYAPH